MLLQIIIQIELTYKLLLARVSRLQIFRIWNDFLGRLRTVSGRLEPQLAAFLRKKRGDFSYAKFSKKVGLPPSTLHRLEMCQQSITLSRLEQIMKRLKCSLSDIFSD
jgi:DNA-binding Xre family transcriptional regulator